MQYLRTVRPAAATYSGSSHEKMLSQNCKTCKKHVKFHVYPFFLFASFSRPFYGFYKLLSHSLFTFFHGVAVAIFANLERALDFEAWGIFWGWALAQLSLKKYAPQ